MGALACRRRRRFLFGSALCTGVLLFLVVVNPQAYYTEYRLGAGDVIPRQMATAGLPEAKTDPLDYFKKTGANNGTTKRNHTSRKKIYSNNGTTKGNYTSPEQLRMVVGIPTIHRTSGADYLEDTLTSLLNHRRSFDRVAFVVLAADTDADRVRLVSQRIKDNHPEEVRSGLIHVITPPKTVYPDWDKGMKVTLGDPFYQVKWRSKQNLDQAYLMEYALSLNPKYYLMLEDDISAADDYLKIIYEHAESVWRDDLLIISYCKWGAIGKLFSGNMLHTISSYLRVFWNHKPLDWLISDLLRITACRYPPTNCDKEIDAIKIDFTHQLFVHNGKISSLRTEKPG